MRIDFRWAALLAIWGAAGACTRAAARPAAGAPLFRGVHETGPDRSAFRLCGSEEEWYVDPSRAPELRPTRVLVARPAPRTECP